MQEISNKIKPPFGFRVTRLASAVLALAASLLLPAAALAQGGSAPPPPPFETHWYTNPFYIIGALLILALVPQIIYQRRKKAAQRDSNQRMRVTPSPSDVGFGLKQPPKKKGRLSKEEMSSLLKASASPAPRAEAEPAPSADQTPPADAAPAAQAEAPEKPELFVPPQATPPIETGPVIKVVELAPVRPAPAIPPTSDDEAFLDAMEQMEDEEGDIRAVAVRILGQFVNGDSIDALSSAATYDGDPSVRAAAVASLGIVAHPSVFPAILGACADRAPEVRLAAARTLSDLKFGRAEAYTRLIAEGDPETLKRAVAACQQTGMTTRAFDRLASQDSRQSYEAYAILSLLVRAGETKPIFNAIAQHPAENVRLAAVGLLRKSGIPGIFQQMAMMAGQSALTPRIRVALLDDSLAPKPGAAVPAEPASVAAAEPLVTAPAESFEEPEITTNAGDVVLQVPPSAAEQPASAPVFRDDPNDPWA